MHHVHTQHPVNGPVEFVVYVEEDGDARVIGTFPREDEAETVAAFLNAAAVYREADAAACDAAQSLLEVAQG